MQDEIAKMLIAECATGRRGLMQRIWTRCSVAQVEGANCPTGKFPTRCLHRVITRRVIILPKTGLRDALGAAKSPFAQKTGNFAPKNTNFHGSICLNMAYSYIRRAGTKLLPVSMTIFLFPVTSAACTAQSFPHRPGYAPRCAPALPPWSARAGQAARCRPRTACENSDACRWAGRGRCNRHSCGR